MNPGKLLEISGSYWRTCTLHAGVKLDVFTAMGDEPKSAEVLAEKLSADKRALAMLLNALTAMGLLEKKGEDLCQYTCQCGFSFETVSPLYRLYHYAPLPFGRVLVSSGQGGFDRPGGKDARLFQRCGMAGGLFDGNVQHGDECGPAHR